MFAGNVLVHPTMKQPSPSTETQLDDEQRATIMTNLFSRFLKDESGATAIEYGLTAVLIGIALIAATTSVGTKMSSTFAFVAAQLNT
jgi:pilus assembly protein Flp/PilA